MARDASVASCFSGRSHELDRLAELEAQVSLVIVCGVGGVGKSSLVRRHAERWPGPVVASEVTDDGLLALVDDAQRQLGGDAVAGGEAERLAALLAALDERAALWRIDDLHRLPPGAARQLLRRAAGLRRGRVIATSRERFLPEPSGPEFGELRIDGLAETAARQLWAALSQLHEPLGEFATAWARSHGNPLLLRCHHAGFLDPNPVAERLASLGADERRVLGALALCECRLPLDLLVGLVGGGEGGEIIARLLRHLAIDVDATGSCRLHDLFREAVLAELAPAQRHALHLELARLLPDCGLDPAPRAREVARHLAAIGLTADGVGYLVRQGTEVDRLVAAGELLRGALAATEGPPRDDEDRSTIVDLGRSLVEVEQVLRADLGTAVNFTAIGAGLAEMRALPGRAEALAREVLGHGELSPGLRIRAMTVLAMALADQDRHDEADRMLADQEAEERDPRAASALCMARGYVLWHAERDLEAYDVIRRGRTLVGSASRSYRLAAVLPALQAAVAARLGHLAEAAQAEREAEAAMAAVDDRLIAAHVTVLVASARFEAGDHAGAEERLRTLLGLARESGHTLGLITCTIALGGVWLAAGRGARAEAVLVEGERLAAARGCAGLVAQARRLRTRDPRRQLADRTVRPGLVRAGLEQRATALAALEAAAAGATTQAVRLLEPLERGATGFDRAAALLARGLLAMLAGQPAELELALERARTILRDAEGEPQVLDEILDQLARNRVVTTQGARLVGADVDLTSFAVVIDERDGLLRHPAGVIELRRRPVLRRLLGAMADRLGTSASKDELMLACAGRPHDPTRDDSALKANMNQLRRWLAPTALMVEFADGGYRLVADSEVVFVRRLAPRV